jgi:hypothetical protein
LDELDHTEVRVVHFKKSYHSVRLKLDRKIPCLFGIFRLLFIQDAGILWRIEKEARGIRPRRRKEFPGNFVHIVNCSIRVNALLVVDAFGNLQLLCQAKVDSKDVVLRYLLEFYVLFLLVSNVSRIIENSRCYRAGQGRGLAYVVEGGAAIVVETVQVCVGGTDTKGISVEPCGLARKGMNVCELDANFACPFTG